MLVDSLFCNIYVPYGAVESTRHLPNQRSNTLRVVLTDNSRDKPVLVCREGLSAHSSYTISCVATFSFYVHSFYPDYVLLSQGSVQSFAIVSASDSSSSVLFVISLPPSPSSTMKVQLLYGAAEDEEESRSQESGVKWFTLHIDSFPVALKLQTNLKDACVANQATLVLRSTASITGVSEMAFSLQGANVTSISRISAGSLMCTWKLMSRFNVTLTFFQTDVSVQVMDHMIFDELMNSNLASGVLSFSFGRFRCCSLMIRLLAADDCSGAEYGVHAVTCRVHFLQHNRSNRPDPPVVHRNLSVWHLQYLRHAAELPAALQ